MLAHIAGRACHDKGDYMSALIFFNRAMEVRQQASSTDPCDDIRIHVGKSLYASGNAEAAIQIYTYLLQKDESNVLALIEYAKAYLDRSQPNQALQILLRVLILSPNDKESRKYISAIVKDT
jgi:tetratricopeptide (TPR) repeat protein